MPWLVAIRPDSGRDYFPRAMSYATIWETTTTMYDAEKFAVCWNHNYRHEIAESGPELETGIFGISRESA